MGIAIAAFIIAILSLHSFFPQSENCLHYPHAYCVEYHVDPSIYKQNENVQLEITEITVNGSKTHHLIPFLKNYIWYHKLPLNSDQPVVYFSGNLLQNHRYIPGCNIVADDQQLSLRYHYRITLYYDKNSSLMQCKKLTSKTYN